MKLQTIAKAGISLLFLTLVLKKISLINIWQAIIKAELGWLLLGLFVVFIFSLLNSWRLFLISNHLLPDSKQKYSQVLKAYFIGYFYNLFFPTSVGGDLMKGVYLSNSNISKKMGVTLSLVDRMAGLFGLAMVGLIGSLIFSLTQLVLPFPTYLPILLFSIIIIGITCLILYSKRILTLPKRFKILRWAGFLEKIEFSRRITLFNLCFLSIFFQLLSIAMAVIVARAINMNIDGLYFFIYVPFLSLIVLLPITISGIGLRETSAIALYTALGITTEKILAFTTIGFSYTALMGIIGGLWQLVTR